jgi:23S rRNA pseudouridine2605 synthase
MRLNKFIASCTDLSRRAADAAIAAGRVSVNGKTAEQGTDISPGDIVSLDGHTLHARTTHTTIMLNKPVGYVCSRNGQGSQTIYDLIPSEYAHLNPIGRLDKDSSGLLLMTDDGELANSLTHPRYQKVKVYEVSLDKPLEPLHQQLIADHGVTLDDGPSQFSIQRIETRARAHHERPARALGGRAESVNSVHAEEKGQAPSYVVTMHEGRNRQIRRTFAALGYTVTALHRIQFGSYSLGTIEAGVFLDVKHL